MTENIKETAEEVKEYIVARLKVPIFFYYLLTLGLWNWDILLLIIKSNFEIESVIWFIKNNYNGHERLWIPLLIAIVSSIVFPAAMVVLDWILKFVSVERIKSAKQVAEAEAEAQYDVQAKRNKTDVLRDLNTKIAQKEAKISELNTTNQNIVDENKNLLNNNKLLKDTATSEISKYKKLEEDKLKVEKELKHAEFKLEKAYDIIETDIEQLLSQMLNLVHNLGDKKLRLILNEIISKDELRNEIEANKSFYSKLLDLGYIVEVDNNNLPFPVINHNLTKKGFALYYFLMGRDANNIITFA